MEKYPIPSLYLCKSRQHSTACCVRRRHGGFTPEKTLDELKEPSNWKTCDLAVIKKARSFLGYSKGVNITIGTQSYPVRRIDENSGAVQEKCRGYWHKRVIFSTGTSGIGVLGAGAAIELGFTKRQIANMASIDMFDIALELSSRTPLLPYDVQKCISWLVPKLSVVLHITHCWFHDRVNKRDMLPQELTKVPSAEASSNGGKSALDCILENRGLKLPWKVAPRTQSWNFIDIIRKTLRALKACRDTKEKAQCSNNISWFKYWRYPRSYGWDLADVISATMALYGKRSKYTRTQTMNG